MLCSALFLAIALDTTSPVFPGGDAQMTRFISDHLRWPKEAGEINFSGHIFVSFTVEKTGQLTDIKVIKPGVLKCFDNEAVNVVKKMPLWIPAKDNGQPIRRSMHIPIRFMVKE